MQVRIGPVGKEDAHYLWPDLPKFYQEQYKEHALYMRKHRYTMFTPDPMRLKGILQLKSCFDRALGRMDSERAHGIGLNMTDIDHLNDIMSR